jgi:hypothetical protein
MKAPAASIRNLLVVVLVLAADFSLIHDLSDSILPPYIRWPPLFRLGFLASLPMANAVVVGGSVILSRGGQRRAFLTGFVLSGVVAVAVLLALAVAAPDVWGLGLHRFPDWLFRWLIRQGWARLSFGQAEIICALTNLAVLFVIPELLIATAGGLVARRRYRFRNNPPAAPGDLSRLSTP